MDGSLNFSIIIFAYNEGTTLFDVVSKAQGCLNKLSPNHEIIIVDDGSIDNTQEVIEQIKKEFKVRVIYHAGNLGIGPALKSGYLVAEKDLVCAVPGDGQFNLNELLKIEAFDENTCYAFYRKDYEYSYYRRMLSAFNRFLNSVFLGFKLRDVNWIKVYRKAHLDQISINLESSLIESEICGKLRKCNVQFEEMPSSYLPREAGVSKGGSFKTVSKAFVELFKLMREVATFKPKSF
jgi:glycosyltransferase involved in cell wall biosynthesis